VKRRALLDPHVASDVRFRDRFSLVNGLADLEPHLAAVHTFMPNLRLERDGVVRHCQGTVVANWVMRSTDGTDRGRGTNVFTLDATGRIRDVVGLWGE
jgi:SnoaL-like domain